MTEILHWLGLASTIGALWYFIKSDRLVSYCVWMIAAWAFYGLEMKLQIQHEHEAATALSARVVALEQTCGADK